MNATQATPKKCPAMCGVRPAKDVQLLLERALNNFGGKTWSDILNRCARESLTPRFANKHIKNVQAEMRKKGKL